MEQLVVDRESLRDITDQFQPGFLVLVAGRPSTGKTSFIIDVLADKATHTANKVNGLGNCNLLN